MTSRIKYPGRNHQMVSVAKSIFCVISSGKSYRKRATPKLFRATGGDPFLEHRQNRSKWPPVFLAARTPAKLGLGQDYQAAEDNNHPRYSYPCRGRTAHRENPQTALSCIFAYHLLTRSSSGRSLITSSWRY